MTSRRKFSLSIPQLQTHWYVLVSREFPLPEYFVGQVVLHTIPVRDGFIAHPVKVIGIVWNDTDWGYWIELPPDHPQFEEDVEIIEVNSWHLEPL